MPLYSYFNPENEEEVIDVIQTMSEPHVFFKDGVEWKRLFYSAQASQNTKIDLYDSKDFARKTGEKKGTLGDMLDASKELSMKRADKNGRDSVKDKFYEDYSKARNGKKHVNYYKDNPLI